MKVNTHAVRVFEMTHAVKMEWVLLVTRSEPRSSLLESRKTYISSTWNVYFDGLVRRQVVDRAIRKQAARRRCSTEDLEKDRDGGRNERDLIDCEQSKRCRRLTVVVGVRVNLSSRR